MNNKLVAVVVVAIVLVAAVAAAIVISGNNDDGPKSTVTGALEVYGNADGDNNITKKDIELIEKIIKDKLNWKGDYPFADANCDGVVDSKDVTMVESILNATYNDQVRVYYNAYSTTGCYVDSFRYPVQYAMTSVNQTTVITLKCLDIVDQIRGYSYSTSFTASHDKYIYGDYEAADNPYKIGDATKVGSSNTAITIDLASNIVTKNGCTAYIYSSANAPLSNREAVNAAGIDTIQIADGVADLPGYSTALLILGFAFGGETYQKAVEFVDWMSNMINSLQEKLEVVYKGEVEQVSAIVSSMTKYVSVKGSTNTNLLEYSGIYSPIASTNPMTGGTSTMTYVDGQDTWLNYIALDSVIVLKGSTSDWSWFDKDYSLSSIPADMVAQMKNFQTLQCYKEGNCVAVTTMIPGPLKAAVIAQYFYPELFEDNWAEDKIGEFLKTYWGFTDSMIKGQKYILTQAEVIG